MCEKNAKPSETIKGIPYRQLKIGVGKEKWTDEKRCVQSNRFQKKKKIEKCLFVKLVSIRIFFFSSFSFLLSISLFRVALTPAVTSALIKKGFTINIEEGAGYAAKFRDDDYSKAGAKIVNSSAALASDIVLKVRQPHDSDIPLLRDSSTLISFLYPARNKPLIDKLSAKKMNAFGTN